MRFVGACLGMLMLVSQVWPSGPLTQDSWTTAVQRKVPPVGTVATGRFKMLCQCTDGGPAIGRVGAIEAAARGSGINGGAFVQCTIPFFQEDGSLLADLACTAFVPLAKP